jgi:2-polyprenyl-3-methyl-5-hydroxy-6-metoxy-1,4-benzoquinol methylase
MSPSSAGPTCLICSTSTRFHCTKGKGKGVGTYYRCTRCETIFLDPMPSAEAMQAYVNEEYAHGAYAANVKARHLKEATFSARAKQIYARQPGGRLLDVGASAGFFVEQAVARGFDAYGLEISPIAIEAAAPAIRPRMRVGDANVLAADGVEKYDVVTAFDIIEHTYDPAAFIRTLRALLHDNGLLVVSTPDTGHFLRRVMGASWPMLQPLQHTVLFSRRSLTGVLREAGFSQISMTNAYKVLTADYLAGQVGALSPAIERAYNLATPVLPVALRRHPVSINIGEMMAFGRV